MNFLLIALGIFLSAVVYMMIGWLWYSPLLFGPMWQQLAGISIDPNSPQFKKDFQRAMIFSPVAAMLTAAVMVCFMIRMDIYTVISGILFGFTAWSGFVAPIALQQVLYAKKPFKLYLINIGYDLTYLMAMGALLVWFI